MALKAEETKIVTINEIPRQVADLPPQAQQLIQFYDDWKQKELEARSELLKVQTAMRGLADQIAALVQQAEDEAAANEEEAVEEVAEEATEESGE